jgi:hypothetical protein
MTEVVMAPDTEAVVIGYLNPLVTPPVSSSVPNPRPAAFVRITASGGEGFVGKLVHRSDVTVEAWSTRRVDAFQLMRQCLGHLEASASFYADADAPAWFPDPDTSTPRYVARVALAVPGSVL